MPTADKHRRLITGTMTLQSLAYAWFVWSNGQTALMEQELWRKAKGWCRGRAFCRWDLASAASLEICSCFLPRYVGVFMRNGSCSESSNVLIHLKENTLSPADTSAE